MLLVILLTTVVTVENFIFNYLHITKRHSKSKVLLSKYLKMLARSASFMLRGTCILYNSKIQAIIRAYVNIVKSSDRHFYPLKANAMS